MHPPIESTELNIIAASTEIEGSLFLKAYSRFEGNLKGKLIGSALIVLGQNALVEGEVHVDEVIIDGCVLGKVFAHKRVVITSTGRVIGEIKTASLKIEFGGYFEGACIYEGIKPTAQEASA